MPWVDLEVSVPKYPPSRKEKEEVLRYARRGAKPRFYADENFPADAVRLLRLMGAWVLTVQEAGRLGHPDTDHTAYALRKGLVLLSCDRDFLDPKRFPLHQCPAIFVLDFGRGTVPEMKQAFRCLGPVFGAPQFFDKWCKVDAGTNSWIESARFLDGSTARTRYRVRDRRIEEWVDQQD
jgi:predicted nuclease of predicted toxin-antitoxin system